MERRGLSGSALKYLAALFMLADHVGVLFPLMDAVVTPDSLLYYLPRYVGRLAFPIFVFFAAEGCRKTRNLSRYLLRLAVFAAVSQIPFSLAFSTTGASMVFTLFLGVGSVYGFERMREREWSVAASALPVLGACVLAVLTRSDYNLAGVLLLFALYLCGEDRRRQLICVGVGMALTYLVYSPLLELLSQPILTAPRLEAFLRYAAPLYVLYFLCAAAAILLLRLYRGERGRGGKWFFYWFYPLHLLALWGLTLLIPA